MNQSGCKDPTAEIAISRAYNSWRREQARQQNNKAQVPTVGMVDKEVNALSFSASAKRFNAEGIMNTGALRPVAKGQGAKKRMGVN